MWVGFVAYLGVLAAAPRLGGRLVWGAIAVALAAFMVCPVLLSHDVYSYVDYARLGVVHGLDPYVHPPAAVPTDPVYMEVRWIDATSAYGPLFTLATYPLAWLGVGAAVAALKVTAALSVLGIAVLVSRIAAARGIEPLRAAAFVALNPLVLVHVVGGAHNDALTMLLVTAAVAALVAGRQARAGASLVAAIAIKLSAAFVAPFALLATARKRLVADSATNLCHTLRPSNRGRSSARYQGKSATADWGALARLLAGALTAALAIGVAAWVAFGWDWTGALGLAGENQDRTSYMSIPITVARLTGLDPDPVRAVAAILFVALVACLSVWTWRGGDWIRAAAWTAFALLAATSWLLPWYLIWPLPLVAVSRDRPLQLLTLALTAYQLGARIPL